MDNYYIIFNKKTNVDFNLKIPKRVSKPAPIMNFEEKPVRGGKTLYVEKGYSDIEISVEFNFKTNRTWDIDFRSVKKWLLDFKDNKLSFSDDTEVFYRVNKVVISSSERLLKRTGKFIVIFTCDPYVYFSDGEYEIELEDYIYNNCLKSRPIYRIVGEGFLTLTVNDKVVKINVGQETVIDTDVGLTYRDGIINNVSLNGKYEDLYLVEGDNNFKWSGNFKIYVTPNWRGL
ncbi:distal tail protein Dit [Clostridium paraputrificum]|uniref:distal tail protein Dit n=1 Tax=Clostridium paraputrificum TaxID=29363 RepID=UPI000C067EA6|nr:distal tail protein Dit [Clostridium paraputrificum]